MCSHQGAKQPRSRRFSAAVFTQTIRLLYFAVDAPARIIINGQHRLKRFPEQQQELAVMLIPKV